MPWILNSQSNQLLLFVLVLTRLSGLLMVAPIYGSSDVPIRVRALLAFALALLITPTQIDAAPPIPHSLVDLAIPMVGELLIGLTLGLGVLNLFLGAQLAGRVISQMSGQAVAEVFDPSTETSMPMFSQLLNLVTLAVFVTIGGHRLVMGALLSTFAELPPGGGFPWWSIADGLMVLVTESFNLGLRAAAPAIAALLLSTLVLGLIGRTMPQFNIIMIGFGINSLVSLGALAISMGAIVWMFEGQIEPMLMTLYDALTAPPPT